jgi:hypothetical protein
MSNLDKSQNVNEEPAGSAATNYIFLSGADMDPTAIRKAHPGATFIARAHLEVRQGEINPHFGKGVAASGRGEVWGIVIETVEQQSSDRQRDVTTDDGRALNAVLAGDRFVNGEQSAVLKTAQYWELYPGYLALLAKVVHPLGIEKVNKPAS